MWGKFQGPFANGVSLDRFLMANWAIYETEWTGQLPLARKSVILRLYLDKGLLTEGDDLLLARVGGRHS